MQILFVHQNFPAQFKHLAPALAARGDRVVALCMNGYAGGDGITAVRSHAGYSSTTTGHPWTADFDTKIIRGEATLRSARRLAEQGFEPDIIIAHPAWGESLFLKQLWPRARLGIYCEYFYGSDAGDTGFDPEFPVADPLANACRLQVRNLAQQMHFDMADAAISPTSWQANTYPPGFRPRIEVIHDGIETEAAIAEPASALTVGDTVLRPGDEVITYAARNLEPYRGYHRFMRALPDLLARRPEAQVLIVGGNGVSYGAAPPAGKTWRDIYLDEVAGRIDRSRVHFLGWLSPDRFRAVLRLSMVHVYLTYPFVLSWSLLDAMATRCAIVASDTAPVREVVDATTGVLVPFFDTEALVDAICGLIEAPGRRVLLGAAARARVVADYDLARCLPLQLAWVDALAGRITPR